MPEHNPEYDDQSESSEDEKPNYQIKEFNEINPLLIQEAAMLREQITKFIKEDTNSGAFVKLNWSAPRDASWLNPMLQCVTADEIFTLLKSSTFVTHDLQCPFHEAIPSFKTDEYYLVLKRWHNLNRGMEFRCFIKGQSLIAISQRDVTAYFEFLPELQ